MDPIYHLEYQIHKCQFKYKFIQLFHQKKHIFILTCTNHIKVPSYKILFLNHRNYHFLLLESELIHHYYSLFRGNKNLLNYNKMLKIKINISLLVL